jgi:glycosyltransferase involved in cell wall biosynthesis
MNIALFEAYYAGSHGRWANELKQHSTHNIQLFTLSGAHWKWRMHGGAITLLHQYLASHTKADLLLCTDMLDVGLLRALLHQHKIDVPVVLYFHENQLTYPPSLRDTDKLQQRDRHYAFLNYTSALAADRIAFNSHYHRSVFLEALSDFLAAFPDHQNSWTIAAIEQKSCVLAPGLNWASIQKKQTFNSCPILLWNHRWEYDKNPELFFQTLFQLQTEGVSFQLIVLGQKFKGSPNIFEEARVRLASRIVHWGYCETQEDYYRLVAQSDILAVTSQQDFFGYSVVEAICSGCVPLLPRRLAYTEHVQGDPFFYDQDEHFYGALKELLQTPLRAVNHQLHQLDWPTHIKKYDTFFEDAISNH